MRLIDADALMRTLGITDMDCNKCEWGENQYCMRGNDFADACYAIEDALTIEERKTGHWIKHKDRSCWYCSECNADDYYAYNWDCDTGEYKFQDNYCPNCGARMGETE